MTGLRLDAAINGMRSVLVRMRADFLFPAMNQLANMVSSYAYGVGVTLKVPPVIRNIEKMLGLETTDLSKEGFYSYEKRFKGPF